LKQSDRSMEDFRANPLRVSLEQQEDCVAIWSRLETLGGFPEPYLRGRTAGYRRWARSYSRQLIREDIRELTEIRSVTEMETLYHLLSSKVGSPLSITGLAQDLRVSYTTVQNWLAIFERFFLTFSLPTWTERVSRAIQKERKVYLLDTPRINDPAARFENQVAVELWRALSNWNALGHGDFSLHFVRNKEKQEVDFLIADGREPFLLVEAKLADEQPTKALYNLQRALIVPAVQLVRDGYNYRTFSNTGVPILVAPATAWIAQLPG